MESPIVPLKGINHGNSVVQMKKQRIVFTPALLPNAKVLTITFSGIVLEFPVAMTEVNANAPVRLIIEYEKAPDA